ncbi:MAG: hypothetical protein KA293_06160 [Bacteroidia bacterium]|nr:hypothetical protein [Bacteroidia bacterium]
MCSRHLNDVPWKRTSACSSSASIRNWTRKPRRQKIIFGAATKPRASKYVRC